MEFVAGSQAYKLERAERAERAHEGVSRPRTKTKVRASWFREVIVGLAVSSVVLGMGVLYVSQHAIMAGLGDELFTQQRALGELQGENGRLRLDLAKLQSLSRVERLARRGEAMVEPSAVAFLPSIAEQPSQAGADSRNALGTRTVHSVLLGAQELAKSAH